MKFNYFKIYKFNNLYKIIYIEYSEQFNRSIIYENELYKKLKVDRNSFNLNVRKYDGNTDMFPELKGQEYELVFDKVHFKSFDSAVNFLSLYVEPLIVAQKLINRINKDIVVDVNNGYQYGNVIDED